MSPDNNTIMELQKQIASKVANKTNSEIRIPIAFSHSCEIRYCVEITARLVYIWYQLRVPYGFVPYKQ